MKGFISDQITISEKKLKCTRTGFGGDTLFIASAVVVECREGSVAIEIPEELPDSCLASPVVGTEPGLVSVGPSRDTLHIKVGPNNHTLGGISGSND